MADGFTMADPPPEPLFVNAADRPVTVQALREVLARAGNLFDRGGVPVMLLHPADGSAPIARRLTFNNVIVEAHKHRQPVKVNEKGEQIPITLPDAVAKMYIDLGDWNLRPLAGITTAPLLASDGRILDRAGYDRDLQLWCEPAPNLAVPDCPTRADAEAALRLLRESFKTFPFRDASAVMHDGLRVVDTTKPPGTSESSLLAALLTACCRPSLWLAPGMLIRAPDISGSGSGKGLLVRAVCAVAFGIKLRAFGRGHDRQELDKRIVSDLIEAGPVLFLDNLNATALRSETLAMVMTERPARVRLMGTPLMVPLNCASFIAVTGNGLSVSEDLGRRFLLVELDAQCEDPEARKFPAGFINAIFAHRGELLSAALTIWRWGRQNEGILTRGLALGSFETWTEWVRDPLLTLGCADPVALTRASKTDDPKRRFAAELFTAWSGCHADRPVKAAELHERVRAIADPQGRGRQYLASLLDRMTGTRAAGFALTKQPSAGRWSAATYALVNTQPAADDGIGHRGHRDHRGGKGADQDPMPPMIPMPYAVAAEGEAECEGEI